MKNTVNKALKEYVWPMLQRPKHLQVAALCHREREGRSEILLVTSRGTGRWIIPKGWPIRGLDAKGAAVHEAWEEAGVKAGQVADTPLGKYTYEKGLDPDWGIPVVTQVFPVAVAALCDDFPERDQRKRMWVSPERAATMVREPGLQHILRDFDSLMTQSDATG